MSLNRCLALAILLHCAGFAAAQGEISLRRDESVLAKTRMLVMELEKRHQEAVKRAETDARAATAYDEYAKEVTARADRYQQVAKDKGPPDQMELAQIFALIAKRSEEAATQAHQAAKTSKVMAVKARSDTDGVHKALVHGSFRFYRIRAKHDVHDAVLACASLLPEAAALKEDALEKSIRQDMATWFKDALKLRSSQVARLLVFSHDSKKMLLLLPNDAGIQLFDAATGMPSGAVLDQTRNPTGGILPTIALSPDTKIAIGFVRLQGLVMWNTETGAIVEKRAHEPPSVKGVVSISPDGKHAVSVSDRTMQFWQVEKLTAVGKPVPHIGGKVNSAVFSPDSKRVLTSAYSVTNLWNPADGTKAAAQISHGGMVLRTVFAPNNSVFVVSTSHLDGSRKAQVWKASGEIMGQAMTHKGLIYALAVSPDGKFVLTGSDDKTAQLWETETGKPVGNALEETNRLGGVAFSPDAKTLLTRTGSSVKLWEASSGRLIDHESFRGRCPGRLLR